jgi:hypothetical protein
VHTSFRSSVHIFPQAQSAPSGKNYPALKALSAG